MTVPPGPAPAPTARDVVRSPGTWRDAARTALTIWWLSRLGLAVTVTGLSWLVGTPPAVRIPGPGAWILERFVWWDAFHYLRIAERGYLPPELPCCDQAFFPGYPLLIRLLAAPTGATLATALVVTQVAGSVAVVLLYRLAALCAAPGREARTATAAVVLLATTPYGLYLSSVYTEAMFLAAALGAWLAGLRRRWWVAGLLASVASATRVTGLFLAAALAVLYLAQLRADGRWVPRRDVVALGIPALPVVAYLAYLWSRTGSWTAWHDAEQLSWHRETAWPWEGFVAGWHALVSWPTVDQLVSRSADLLATTGGLAGTGWLALRRRWAEATYVGLHVLALAASTMIVSAPRYALAWFPLYLALARWAVRSPGRGRLVWLATGSAVFMVGISLEFSLHWWVA